MTSNSSGQPSAENPAPRKRRQRYSGTHPKTFGKKYKELDPDSFPHMQEHVRTQGRTPAGTHIPVMVSDVMESLCPKPGEIVADCTLGYGGHAIEFLKRIGATGCLIGLDVDAAQLDRTRTRLTTAFSAIARETIDPTNASQSPLRLHRSHFAGLGKIMTREGIQGCDIIFADLGVSSMQIDDPTRGFSYKHDGPLDMRMDDRLLRKAADFLAQLSREEFEAALEELADEPDAKSISESIVLRRAILPITRTGQLVDLVFDVKGMTRRAWRERPAEQRGQLHPAAKTFQALRMLVNDEMSGLSQFLRIAPHCLRAGGRIGIISFHSGEDRRVSEDFRQGLSAGTYSEISETPIRPPPDEIAANPRSRSALLRWTAKSRL